MWWGEGCRKGGINTIFELILRDDQEFVQLGEGMDEGQGSL